MKNEYLQQDIEIGTVLKEHYDGEKDAFYLVGPYFIYCNDYDFPLIRPHKFVFDDHISIASENEKAEFFKALNKNNLIVNEDYSVRRAYEHITISANIKYYGGTINKEELIEKLNNIDFSSISEIVEIKFTDF